MPLLMRLLMWGVFLGGHLCCGMHDGRTGAPFAEWSRATNSSAESPVNIVYIKVGKCASTQSAMITQSVSHWLSRWRERRPGRVALGNPCKSRDAGEIGRDMASKGDEPIFHNSHGERRFVDTSLLGMGRTFFWTVIRHPASRCLSWYYFQQKRRSEAARDPYDPTGEAKIAFLSEACADYVYKYAAPRALYDAPCRALLRATNAGL